MHISKMDEEAWGMCVYVYVCICICVKTGLFRVEGLESSS